jgi:hypothetical protein
MKRLVVPLAGLGLLAACAEMPPADPKPPLEREGICDASTLGWTTGKPADAALVQKAQAESGARMVRTLRPGQVVTMEYSQYRLNLYLDANDRVERASCG